MAADRLTLTPAFESAGIKSDAAEQIATEIYDAIHDNVATKTDVDHSVTTLRAEIRGVETTLRAEVREVEQWLKLWLGSLIVVVASLLFAALHYWPPRG